MRTALPVTRLLGQSPAGLSATGDSDTRNYYDMISSRQELDLRPQLERLDALLERSAGVEPGALRFSFRPLWQMSAAERAGVALQKAQATAIYAGLKLWPAATTAALVRSQLIEDGTYPGAAAAFEAGDIGPTPNQIGPHWAYSAVADYSPDQPRDPDGRWAGGGGREGGTAAEAYAPVKKMGAPAVAKPAPAEAQPSSRTARGSTIRPRSSLVGSVFGWLNPFTPTKAQEVEPEEESRRPEEERDEQEGRAGEANLGERYEAATRSLAEVAPRDPALSRLSAPGAPVSSNEVEAVEAALRQAVYHRTCDFIRPNGRWIGEALSRNTRVRTLPGGLKAAQEAYEYLSRGGVSLPFARGSRVVFPGRAGTILLRPKTSTEHSPAIDINIEALGPAKLHYR